MTTITYCDRCSDVIEGERTNIVICADKVIAQARAILNIPSHLDLCPQCARVLINYVFTWWDNRTNK